MRISLKIHRIQGIPTNLIKLKIEFIALLNLTKKSKKKIEQIKKLEN